MLNTLTISQLRQKLAKREISARELTQACIDKVRKVDGEIHAFQRLHARVLLRDSPDLEQRLSISLHSRERTPT